MIEVKKGDYCIASVDKKVRSEDDEDAKGVVEKKLVLMKVTGQSSSLKEINGRLEKDPHIKAVTVSPKATDVLINLGRTPKPGKVYGFDLSKIYLGSKEHDAFGEIHFFTNPEEKSVNQLWTSLDSLAKKLNKHGLSKLLELPTVYELIPKHGKYAGMYIHSKDTEKYPNRMQLSVGEKTLETASIANYTYVGAHELGHVLHFNCLPTFNKHNSNWIELYSDTIKPRTLEAARCLEIGKEVATTEGGLKAFWADAEEDMRVDLKLIMKWIREVKSVTSKELDMLLLADTKTSMKAFKSIWPQVDIQSKELKPLISEYATKNWREAFAEAFAFYMCDKKLPDRVTELVEKSIELARGTLKTM